MGKEGASNLVSLLSKSLEPVVGMHNNDCVICSCESTVELGFMCPLEPQGDPPAVTLTKYIVEPQIDTS